MNFFVLKLNNFKVNNTSNKGPIFWSLTLNPARKAQSIISQNHVRNSNIQTIIKIVKLSIAQRKDRRCSCYLKFCQLLQSWDYNSKFEWIPFRIFLNNLRSFLYQFSLFVKLINFIKNFTWLFSILNGSIKFSRSDNNGLMYPHLLLQSNFFCLTTLFGELYHHILRSMMWRPTT